MELSDSEEFYLRDTRRHYMRLVRMRMLAFCGHLCERCNRPRPPRGLHVHHDSYAHWGSELTHMGDLRLLCVHCHEMQHPEKPGFSVPSEIRYGRPRNRLENDGVSESDLEEETRIWELDGPDGPEDYPYDPDDPYGDDEGD